MKTVLFLHGFYASGCCPLAIALREGLEGVAVVLTPDIPRHPKEALAYIEGICKQEHPDLLVGNSCGSFYAQMLANKLGIPALLGNPHLEMTAFLSERIGKHEYKSPRMDGRQELVINEELIAEFEGLQSIQFDNLSEAMTDKIWGIFGEQDTLAHYEPVFLEHYKHSFHFPGGHTPTPEEAKDYYVPLVKKMLEHYTHHQMVFDYFEHVGFAVTICDKDGIVVYQNKKSRGNDGSVIGRNLFKCHKEKSNEKIRHMIATGDNNTYEIIKHGKRFLIRHSPWYDTENGSVAGLIELSIPLPDEYPTFNRDKKR